MLAAAPMRVVVASFSHRERLRAYRAEQELTFTCLADPERSVYGAYRLSRGSVGQVFHPRTLARYAELFRRGRCLRRLSGDLMQMGGDFLVGPDGRLRLVYYSAHPADRPSVAQVLASL